MKKEEIGTRLRRLRLKSKLSLKQVSEHLQIPLSTYRDWEYGSSIKGEPYLGLAHLFRVSLMEILNGHDHGNQPIVDNLNEIVRLADKIRTQL